MAQSVYLALNADRKSENIIEMLRDVLPAGAKRGFDVAVDAVMDVKIYAPIGARNVLVTGEGMVIKETGALVTTITIPTDVADKEYYVVCRYEHGVSLVATYAAVLIGAVVATDTPLAMVKVPGGAAALTSAMIYPYPRSHVNEGATSGLQLYNGVPISGVYGDYIRKTQALGIGAVVNDTPIAFGPGVNTRIAQSFQLPVGFKASVQSFNDPSVSTDHLVRLYLHCTNVGAAGNISLSFEWREYGVIATTVVTPRALFVNPALNEIVTVDCDIPAAFIASWGPTANLVYRLKITRAGADFADTYGGTFVPAEAVLQYPINRLGAAYTT